MITLVYNIRHWDFFRVLLNQYVANIVPIILPEIGREHTEALGSKTQTCGLQIDRQPSSAFSFETACGPHLLT